MKCYHYLKLKKGQKTKGAFQTLLPDALAKVDSIPFTLRQLYVLEYWLYKNEIIRR